MDAPSSFAFVLPKQTAQVIYVPDPSKLDRAPLINSVLGCPFYSRDSPLFGYKTPDARVPVMFTVDGAPADGSISCKMFSTAGGCIDGSGPGGLADGAEELPIEFAAGMPLDAVGRYVSRLPAHPARSGEAHCRIEVRWNQFKLPPNTNLWDCPASAYFASGGGPALLLCDVSVSQRNQFAWYSSGIEPEFADNLAVLCYAPSKEPSPAAVAPKLIRVNGLVVAQYSCFSSFDAACAIRKFVEGDRCTEGRVALERVAENLARLRNDLNCRGEDGEAGCYPPASKRARSGSVSTDEGAGQDD